MTWQEEYKKWKLIEEQKLAEAAHYHRLSAFHWQRFACEQEKVANALHDFTTALERIVK